MWIVFICSRAPRRFQLYDMARWLFSKFSPRGTGYVTTPAAVQAVLNAIMLTTGKTDRPWTLAKHGNLNLVSLTDSLKAL
eukprot:COSAG02_NODE_1295_length_13400_cov_5.691828_16_plen_80_part_00